MAHEKCVRSFRVRISLLVFSFVFRVLFVGGLCIYLRYPFRRSHLLVLRVFLLLVFHHLLRADTCISCKYYFLIQVPSAVSTLVCRSQEVGQSELRFLCPGEVVRFAKQTLAVPIEETLELVLLRCFRRLVVHIIRIAYLLASQFLFRFSEILRL